MPARSSRRGSWYAMSASWEVAFVARFSSSARSRLSATGIGIVEAYDLDRTVNSKLANISSRGFLQTGNNVMSGGSIVGGTDSQKAIVRAIGPSLPVPRKLADPTDRAELRPPRAP